jgi:hypothetical protein
MLNEQGRVLLFRRAMSFFSRTSAPGSGRILRAEVTVERPDATVLSNGMAAADFDTCPPCRPKLSPKQAAQMGSSLRNGGLAVQASGGCLLIVRQEHGRLGGSSHSTGTVRFGCRSRPPWRLGGSGRGLEKIYQKVPNCGSIIDRFYGWRDRLRRTNRTKVHSTYSAIVAAVTVSTNEP